jgi:hypothetical protein
VRFSDIGLLFSNPGDKNKNLARMCTRRLAPAGDPDRGSFGCGRPLPRTAFAQDDSLNWMGHRTRMVQPAFYSLSTVHSVLCYVMSSVS